MKLSLEQIDNLSDEEFYQLWEKELKKAAVASYGKQMADKCFRDFNWRRKMHFAILEKVKERRAAK